MLYDMTDGVLTKVLGTTFKAEQVLERKHLQAAVRDNIAVLGADLLVVAEEFGEFEDANRRIDLLCVDKAARLVVVSSWLSSSARRTAATWSCRLCGTPHYNNRFMAQRALQH